MQTTFLNTIFKLQNTNHTSSTGNGHCSPPPPPPPNPSLDISRDKGGNECCPLRHRFSNEWWGGGGSLNHFSHSDCVYISLIFNKKFLVVNCVPKFWEPMLIRSKFNFPIGNPHHIPKITLLDSQ